MPPRTWTIVDSEAGVYLPQLDLNAADFAGDYVRGLRVTKRVLRGGLSDDVDVLELENGAVRLAVLPTRGMGIWRAWCGDVELGWRSPVRGPVNPKFVNLHEASGIGWLSGFDEWLCRCGLESNGAPEWDADGRLRYPLHGRIANLPAHRVEVVGDGQAGQLIARGTVDEARLFGRKLRLVSTIRMQSAVPGFAVTDEVTNLSSEPTDFELLYHINFGLPWLRPGASLVAPVAELAPRDPHSATDVAHWNSYGPEQPGLDEFVHFFKLAADRDGLTGVLLKTAEDRGVMLRYDARQLPCFTLWKCHQPAADGYVTGLEPGTNYPNVRSYEERQGRTARLEPGASRAFSLDFEVVTSRERMHAVEQEIAALAAGRSPRVFNAPQPGWSPEGDSK
ncbi:MAG: aldose 1-epimerase family protein [Planctomycetia bacterium]|nr:aldose 1-epimerase family protein [Planctomycetia bacterium]